MKKILCLLIEAVLLLTIFTGCGNSDNDESESTSSVKTESVVKDNRIDSNSSSALLSSYSF